MKRFCIIGPVVPQAALLERMTRLFAGVSILCPSSMFAELGLELLLQSVAIARLPGAPKERVIASVEGAKKMATDEWMYQLKEGESGDPFMVINKFFEAAADGDAARALEFAAKATTHSDKVLAGEAEMHRVAEALRQNQPDKVALEYGLYYDKCVAPI
jgi:hypothetical protein